MARARMKITTVIDYELQDPGFEDPDPHAMARADQEAAQDDPFIFLDCDEAVWTVDVEVLQ